MGDACKIFAGGTPSTLIEAYWHNGSINWIQSGLIQDCEINEDKITEKITELGLKNSSSKIIKPNTALLAMTGATCGKSAYLTCFSAANQSVMAFETDELNSKFLFYIFQKNKAQILSHQAGGAQAGINKSTCENFLFNFPSKAEQDEISCFIYNIDTLITLHQRKCDRLKKVKQGLLEKMFPTEKEDTPKIRFKGFTEPWEQRKLNELGNVETGNTPSTSIKEYYSEEGLIWITPTDITSNITLTTEKKLSEKGEKVARVIPANSILCTCIASIGKNTFSPVKCAFNQQINALIPSKSNDPYFLFVDSYNWSQSMLKGAGGLTFQIVNKTEFSNIVTFVPSIGEQKKIGYLFYKLDNLITLHQRKCKKLKNIKSALLERMFV